MCVVDGSVPSTCGSSSGGVTPNGRSTTCGTVTSGRLVLVDRVDAELSGRGQRLLRYEGGWRGLEWWLRTCTIPGHDKDHAGWHRAVIHASGGAPR